MSKPNPHHRLINSTIKHTKSANFTHVDLPVVVFSEEAFKNYIPMKQPELLPSMVGLDLMSSSLGFSLDATGYYTGYYPAYYWGTYYLANDNVVVSCGTGGTLRGWVFISLYWAYYSYYGYYSYPNYFQFYYECNTGQTFTSHTYSYTSYQVIDYYDIIYI